MAMDLMMLDKAIGVMVAVAFAWVAIAGCTSAIKFTLLDFEIRHLAKVQSDIIEGMQIAYETHIGKRKEKFDELR